MQQNDIGKSAGSPCICDKSVPQRNTNNLRRWGTGAVLAVLLTWQDNSTTETGFLIERARGSTTAFSLLATLPPDTQTYRDARVKRRWTYCYRARALAGAETSAPSNTVCLTIPR